MLALTRKNQQAVEVWHGGELLRLIVVESRSGSVKVAFDGPRSFVVLREGMPRDTPPGDRGEETTPDGGGEPGGAPAGGRYDG